LFRFFDFLDFVTLIIKWLGLDVVSFEDHHHFIPSIYLETMEESIANIIEKSVLLRRDLHAHPEPHFDVVETVQRIRKFLVDVAGVEESQMQDCAENGLIVDLVGKAPAIEGNSSDFVHNIALRADTDALPMTEKNHQLPYRSRNEGVAHMCGMCRDHLGHHITWTSFFMSFFFSLSLCV
jgi:hypothetical protein